MTLPIDKILRLERLAEAHAEALFAIIEQDRAHLAEFLPWVPRMQSAEDFRRYVQSSEALHREKTDVSFAVVRAGAPVGRIGLHAIHLQNKSAALGYWLGCEAEGLGIMTQACKTLLTYGFRELGLQRIELKAAVENSKSRAVAERLRFRQEGILRQAELVNGRFLDLALYAMLRDEWVA